MPYVSVVEANTYFEGLLGSDAWFEASANQQEQALETATKIMDRQLFKGKKKVATQELQFPRCYRNYPWPEEIAETQTGWYCELCVHQRVKDACCEEALALLVRGNSPRLKLQREGVQSFSVDGLSETYQAGFGKGLLSQEAKELLKPYLAKAVSITC